MLLFYLGKRVGDHSSFRALADFTRFFNAFCGISPAGGEFRENTVAPYTTLRGLRGDRAGPAAAVSASRHPGGLGYKVALQHLKEKARFPPQITPLFRSFAFFFLGPGGREKSDFLPFRKVEGAPLAEDLAKKTCI